MSSGQGLKTGSERNPRICNVRIFLTLFVSSPRLKQMLRGQCGEAAQEERNGVEILGSSRD